MPWFPLSKELKIAGSKEQPSTELTTISNTGESRPTFVKS